MLWWVDGEDGEPSPASLGEQPRVVHRMKCWVTMRVGDSHPARVDRSSGTDLTIWWRCSKRLAGGRPRRWPCHHQAHIPTPFPWAGATFEVTLEGHCPATGPEENGPVEPRPAGPGRAHLRKVRAQLGSWSHMGPTNRRAPLPPTPAHRRHTLHFPVFSIHEPFPRTCPHSVQTSTCLRWGRDR